MPKLFLGLAGTALLVTLSNVAFHEGRAQSDELTVFMEPTLAEEIYKAIAERRYDIAVPLLKDYSDRGNAEADFLLGNSYYYGTGVEKI